MPGGVARTSTQALTNATLPYVMALAAKGPRLAMEEDRYLRDGLNVHAGHITHPAVAEALGLDYTPAMQALTATYAADVEPTRRAP
jgi:alanine dehydrogenase